MDRRRKAVVDKLPSRYKALGSAPSTEKELEGISAMISPGSLLDTGHLTPGPPSDRPLLEFLAELVTSSGCSVCLWPRTEQTLREQDVPSVPQRVPWST